MNSDQTKKAREAIFGMHVHMIQGSIHAKFQDPTSWMIFTNGKNLSQIPHKFLQGVYPLIF